MTSKLEITNMSQVKMQTTCFRSNCQQRKAANSAYCYDHSILDMQPITPMRYWFDYLLRILPREMFFNFEGYIEPYVMEYVKMATKEEMQILREKPDFLRYIERVTLPKHELDFLSVQWLEGILPIREHYTEEARKLPQTYLASDDDIEWYEQRVKEVVAIYRQKENLGLLEW